MPRKADIRNLLHPRSIAIVGASDRPGSQGIRNVQNAQLGNFQGAIYPINPRCENVLGLKCYPSLSALPEVPDAIFIGLGSAAVLDTLEEAGKLGVGAAVVNASGFSDSGPDGAELQAELVRVADLYGIAVCGPNTNGVMSLLGNAYLTSFTPPDNAQRGAVAVCTQSGSFANMLSRDIAGLGLSYVVSGGNEAMLTTAEYLEAFVDEVSVRTILLTLEAVRRPEALARAALAGAAKGKTIIAAKVGRSERGRAAVQAHTGAMAGEDALYDAFFRRLGIVRVDDLDQMVETAAMFNTDWQCPTVKGVVPVTFSGGHAALLADIAEQFQVAFPILSESTCERLQAIFPAWWNPGNPLDAWGAGWDAKRFRETLEILAEDAAVGLIVMVLMPQPARRIGVEVTQILREVAENSHVRFAVISDSSGGPREPGITAVLKGSDVPYLSGLRNGMLAISKRLHHRPPENERSAPSSAFIQKCRSFAANSNSLDEAERFGFFRSIGLPMSECVRVSDACAASKAAQELGFPVVLKGSAPDVAHKSELGLVALNIRSKDDVAGVFESLSANLAMASHSPQASIVVQNQASPGVEIILGVRNYPGFGSLLVVGPGGIFVDLLKQSSVRLGPVDERTAREMLDETPAGALLRGFRGARSFDIEAAVRSIVLLSEFGMATIDSVATIEINPLIVGPVGAVAVDLVLELSAVH